MAYVRTKIINGRPYRYMQESYRVGDKVKTRHIRYIGKGSGTGPYRNHSQSTPQRAKKDLGTTKNKIKSDEEILKEITIEDEKIKKPVIAALKQIPEEDYKGVTFDTRVRRHASATASVNKIHLKIAAKPVILHELGHVVSFRKNFNAYKVEERGKRILRVPSDEYQDVVTKSFERYEKNKYNEEFEKEANSDGFQSGIWDYPFNYGQTKFPGKRGESFRKDPSGYKELFAESYAQYYLRPKEMKKWFPEMYEYMNNRKYIDS